MRMNSLPSAQAQFILASNRIDIWQYSLHDLFEEAPSFLNDEETTRAHRFHFARHQRRFTIARARLRQILSNYLNCTPQELVFGYHAQGKPYLLKNPKKIEFNLSHSGEMALLAIGQEHPLGVDVEYFSKRPYIGIAQQLFSEIEMRAMKNAPSFMEPMIFFHIWAQKEAFIKASGLGLSYPTQRFDVQAYPQTHQAIHDPMLHHDWHMVSFMPEIACCAALCHHPCIEQINYFKI